MPTGGVGCCGTFSFNSGWQGSNIASNFLFLLPMIPGKIPGTPAASGTGLQVNPGGQTVYDPIANVTWLADANVAASNTFGLPACTDVSPKACVNSNGAMNFNSATQFIQNMNAAAYLGQSNWQIPPVDPNCAASYLCSVKRTPFPVCSATSVEATRAPVVTAPNIGGTIYEHPDRISIGHEAMTDQQPVADDQPAAPVLWSDLLVCWRLRRHRRGAPRHVRGGVFVGIADIYSLNAGGQTFNGLAGTGTIAITLNVPRGASALPSWITLTSPSSGVGSSTVTFEVAANHSLDSDLSLRSRSRSKPSPWSRPGGHGFVGFDAAFGGREQLDNDLRMSTKGRYQQQSPEPSFTPLTGRSLHASCQSPDQPSVAGPYWPHSDRPDRRSQRVSCVADRGTSGAYQKGSTRNSPPRLAVRWTDSPFSLRSDQSGRKP